LINTFVLFTICNVERQKFTDVVTKVQRLRKITTNHGKSRQMPKFTANAKIHGIREFREFVI